ncbi:MAG: hypothetical protein AB7N54_08250 [Alphaproteobacteria bacterium]
MFRRCVAAFLLVAGIAGGASEARAGFINGAEYLDMEDYDRTTYVMGLIDMLEEMGRANHTVADFLNRVVRCTGHMNGDQLRDFVDTYMASDRSLEQYSMASNVSGALNTRCPY